MLLLAVLSHSKASPCPGVTPQRLIWFSEWGGHKVNNPNTVCLVLRLDFPKTFMSSFVHVSFVFVSSMTNGCMLTFFLPAWYTCYAFLEATSQCLRWLPVQAVCWVQVQVLDLSPWSLCKYRFYHMFISYSSVLQYLFGHLLRLNGCPTENEWLVITLGELPMN